MVLGPVHSLELGQSYGKHAVVIVGRCDQGPQQAVPAIQEDEDSQCSQGAFGKREHDLQIRANLAGAVDPRRVEKLIGQGHDRLPHQKDAEGAHHAGDDQDFVGIQPFQITHQHEQGHDDDMEGDHHCRQDEQKQRILPRKVVLGEPIPRQTAKEEVQQRDRCADKQAVEKVTSEWRGVHGLGIVRPAPVRRNPLNGDREDFVRRFERAGQHPDQRNTDNQRAQSQDHIEEDAL